jgi:hypothetical protein
LAYHGRQSLHGLVKHTRLPLRQIKPSLVILVQHHMVMYDKDETNRTHYTANGDAAYNMAFRFGKFAAMVQEQWGENAAYVFRKLATLGQSTINHLAAECDKDKVHPISIHELRRIVHDFLKYGYLSSVTKHNFQPEHIFEAEVESQILVEFNGPPKGKDKPLAEGLKVQYRRRMRDRAFHYLEEEEPPTKRRRLTKPVSNGIKKPITEVQDSHDSDLVSSAPDVKIPDTPLAHFTYFYRTSYSSSISKSVLF